MEKAEMLQRLTDTKQYVKDMMLWANVSEQRLLEEKEIKTEILYAENDNLTSRETVETFCNETNSVLTIMAEGEHWFYTKSQLEFLDDWLKRVINSELRQK